MPIKRYISNPPLILSVIVAISGAIMILVAWGDAPALGETSVLKAVFGSGVTPSGDNLSFFRLIPIATSLILLTLLYLWSAKLLGKFWALLPTALLAFSPVFLDIGHYFKRDIFDSLGLLIFTYCFIESVTNLTPSIRHKDFHKVYLYALPAGLLALTSFTSYGIGSFSHFLDLSVWADIATGYLFKEPLAVILLIIIAAIFSFKNILAKASNVGRSITGYVSMNPTEFGLMILIPCYFVLASLRNETNLTEHTGILALVFILSASAIKHMVNRVSALKKTGHLLVLILVSAELAASLSTLPHLSSFTNLNASIFEVRPYLINGPYDTGADLARFSEWAKEQRNKKIGLDYFGEANPKSYLGENYIPWESAYSAPDEIGLNYLAVSLQRIYSAKKTLGPGEIRTDESRYLWIKDIDTPYLRIGTIWIYKLD